MADMLWFSHNAFFRWNARRLGRGYCEAGQLSRPVRLDNGSPSRSWASIGGLSITVSVEGETKNSFRGLQSWKLLIVTFPASIYMDRL
jgi:hypothetical protein